METKKQIELKSVYTGFFGLICFIIGLTCYLLGCNSELEGQCTNYSIINGNVYSTQIRTDTCSRCRHYCKDNNGNRYCCSREYYDCYDAFVYANYGKSNNTCWLQTSSDSSYSSAEESLSKYDIGDHVNWLKRKNSGTKECITPKQAMDLWIVGITFLSLCGFCVIILSYFYTSSFSSYGS